MPITPEPLSGERSLADIRVGPPPPIDDAWKDEAVESLMRELRRQLRQIENSKPTASFDDAPLRSCDVQSLVRIERTLTHLFEVHEQRALSQDKDAATRHDDALRQLGQRIDRLIAAAETGAAETKSGEPDDEGAEPPS